MSLISHLPCYFLVLSPTAVYSVHFFPHFRLAPYLSCLFFPRLNFILLPVALYSFFLHKFIYIPFAFFSIPLSLTLLALSLSLSCHLALFEAIISSFAVLDHYYSVVILLFLSFVDVADLILILSSRLSTLLFIFFVLLFLSFCLALFYFPTFTAIIHLFFDLFSNLPLLPAPPSSLYIYRMLCV